MRTFEQWYTKIFGGHITESQAGEELLLAYEYFKENEKLKYQLSIISGKKAIWLEIDGKDMTDVYNLQREITEKDVIIKFLKKELAHKSSYRQVMKLQYKELKDKYDAIAPKERYLQNQLIAEMVVSGWSEEEKEELLNKWKEINKRHKE